MKSREEGEPTCNSVRESFAEKIPLTLRIRWTCQKDSALVCELAGVRRGGAEETAGKTPLSCLES